MTPPWKPDDQRWGWVLLVGLALAFFVLLFRGHVAGQPGDVRPTAQTIPIMSVDSSGRLVVVGDFTNHAIRVNMVAGGVANVTVTSSALPAGASTDASVQNIEAAIREAQTFYGSTFPIAGQSVAAIDPSGFTASIAVTNAGGLVTSERGAANLANAQVSVTVATVTVAAARATRRSVTIVNHGSTDVFLGSSGVTTSTGFLLPGVRGAAVTLFTTAAVQGLVSTGTQSVGVIEEYH